MMRKTRIELGDLPDRRLNPNRYRNRYEHSRAKREAKDLAYALVNNEGIPKTPYNKAHITITWIAGDKIPRDPDNLLASMKAYIDGLVAVGLIVDDSAKHVSYNPKYERGEKHNTIIEIEEIE